MLLIGGSTILPGWLVLPAATITLLVIAAHVVATGSAGEERGLPVRRRRLRIANGLLMMFVTALLAYALGVAGVIEDPTARPDQTRRFVLVWMSIVGLVCLVVALACADALATVAHAWSVRRALRQELRHTLAGDLSAARSAGRKPGPAERSVRDQDQKRDR